MISGIHHTSFTVSEMGRSIAFYRDVLGMKMIWDSIAADLEFKGPIYDLVTGCPGTEQRIVFMAIGDNQIELVQYTPTGKALKNNLAGDTGSTHVCFQVDNIHALYEKLKANGQPIHCKPQDMGSVWVMYFRDPDGIILEAVQGQMPT